jgi:hypothetical protein
MAKTPNPLRRVVTGHNADGKSCVIFDSDAPNVFHRPDINAFFNDFWRVETIPAVLSGNEDEGSEDRMFGHSPPARGALFRIVQSAAPKGGKPRDLKLEQEHFSKMNPGGVSELKVNGPVPVYHRTPTVDYGLNLGCDRHLVLDDSEVVVKWGDVAVQLGNFHAWDNRSGQPGCMAFDMIGGEFPD